MPWAFPPWNVTQFLATTLRLEEQRVLQLWSRQNEFLRPLLTKLRSAQNPQYLPLFFHARQDQITKPELNFLQGALKTILDHLFKF